jgi:NADH:ubiquinone oxidoreductase subunit K
LLLFVIGMGKVLKFFGILFLLVGVTVLFNSFQGITGFAVYGDVDIDAGYFVAAWFVVVGMLLVAYRRNEVEKVKKKSQK